MTSKSHEDKNNLKPILFPVIKSWIFEIFLIGWEHKAALMTSPSLNWLDLLKVLMTSFYDSKNSWILVIRMCFGEDREIYPFPLSEEAPSGRDFEAHHGRLCDDTQQDRTINTAVGVINYSPICYKFQSVFVGAVIRYLQLRSSILSTEWTDCGTPAAQYNTIPG